MTSPAGTGRIRHPALMLLTSHRRDCFELCLWCLERFTDLDRFRTIYVLDNDVEPDHRQSVEAFVGRRANARHVRCSPRGLVPAVMEAQNRILARHADEGVVKLDEDVFVGPHWLDHLLAAHRQTRTDPSVLLVGCPTPVSVTGRQCLTSFHRSRFPQIARQGAGSRVFDDPEYHLLVWKAVLEGRYLEEYARFPHGRYFLTPSLIIHCVLYDRKAVEVIGPFPTGMVGGAPVTDELAVNMALRRANACAVLPSAALAHHYSHARCLEAMLAAVPPQRIARWMRQRYGERDSPAQG